MAYKLTCKEDGGNFYFFKTHEAEEFIQYMKDHNCRELTWELEEVSIDDIPKKYQECMVLPLTMRAKAALLWAYSLLNRLGKEVKIKV